MCSYVEKYGDFKNQTLGTQNAMCNGITWGWAISQISTEIGDPMPNNLI